MSLRGEDALILAQDYVDETLKGAGALKGQDGVSPVISVNTSTADTYKLDITDKNGTITTPNLVGKQGERGEVGETGADGETPTITENADNTEEVYKLDFTTKNGTFTTKNIKGKQGLEGISPTVTTNPDNTTEDYRLNITTKGGSFTTPNLRGPQGERGPIGESAVSAINPRGDYDVNAEPSYTKSDYITYTDGNTYVCKVDNPTNEPPIDGTVTDTYWQVIAFRGAQGIAGKDGEKGADGVTFTPSIDENADNTEEVYKLDFTTKNGTFTTKNIKGKQGLEGISPTVTTNPDNTTEDYRLNITTKGGSFTTPNLRGPQGERGPIGESAVSAINPRGDYDVNAEPSYTKSDYITYTDGNTYVCKVDNPTNEPPIDGTVTDTYWQVIAFRGAQGIAGKDGEKGADGVTFTPSIDENGVLSFTNNGGLENPEPIDIKGDNGITFTPSIDADGYLSFTNNGNLENPEPIKVLGKDGADGKDGIDGTTYIPSIGTVTTVESNADASVGVTVDEETK